ncbi:hypothetical protein QVD17_31494 [Tagetes erecta]|uniref:Uncharacterized protein n=1 Tax=Tagetes erecta TaxID=13708 RepID=A0AAD8K4L9_TARER|nr:hypothetical protein QVD17_31494 [Tagetes erecta]
MWQSLVHLSDYVFSGLSSGQIFSVALDFQIGLTALISYKPSQFHWEKPSQVYTGIGIEFEVDLYCDENLQRKRRRCEVNIDLLHNEDHKSDSEKVMVSHVQDYDTKMHTLAATLTSICISSRQPMLPLLIYEWIVPEFQLLPSYLPYVGTLRELLEQLAVERTPEGLPRSDLFTYAPDCFTAN